MGLPGPANSCEGAIPIGPNFILRPMLSEDLDQVTAIEAASFISPWTRKAFLAEIVAPFARAFVVLDHRRGDVPVAGYLCFWEVAEDLHLLNVCVAPSYRGQGLGGRLMDFLSAWGNMRGKRKIQLEVRPDNHPALNLYKRFGFRQVGVRRGYYSDTGQDALLLDLILPGTPASQ